MSDVCKIKRAILSVSDKEGIVEMGKFLQSKNVEIFSTGGTYKKLQENGVCVKEVNEITKFPEMMDGRVKTLNPYVHGGILALRDNEKHVAEAKEHGISFIDLLIVNLYPFEQTISNPEVSLEDAIENIDIGGPTMLRSCAKNYKYVTIITDPCDYQEFMTEMDDQDGTSLGFREKCALKVFRKTYKYDSAISTFLEKRLRDNEQKVITLNEGKTLRYGENSHQNAKMFLDENGSDLTLAGTSLLNGKEMSYNNYMDAQAAIDMVMEFEEPACSVIKHMNPCGVATGNNSREAIEKAWYGDPISAMGSVVAFNSEFTMDTLRFFRGKETPHYSFQVTDNELITTPIKRKFIEVIIAPSFSSDALEYLTTKKNCANVRVLQVNYDEIRRLRDFQIKRIDGGYLVQDNDDRLYTELNCVTERKFSAEMKELAIFSMKSCKIVKSNAIVLCRRNSNGTMQMLGMGAGQPNRVDSLRKLAVTKARENLEYEFKTKGLSGEFNTYFKKVMSEEVVMASDAFFPYDDTVRTAAEFGVKYIIQPGGSMNDEDSVKACNELGIAMYLSGNRHFRH